MTETHQKPIFLEPQKKQTKPYRKRAPPPKNLQCDQCDYITRYKNCLVIHILGHSNTKPFTCSQCDYKTKYPLSLKRHTFIKHDNFESKEGLTTYNCDMCSYKTCLKWNLKSHLRKHDLTKKYKCSQCSFCTSYKHNMTKHSRKHRKPDQSYYCDKCPFATKYEGNIARHLETVHYEAPEKASRCENCSFLTKTGWRLNLHKKRSQQDSPVKCAECDYETIYHCALNEHKMTHSLCNKNYQEWLDSLFIEDFGLNNKNVQNKERASVIVKLSEIRSELEVDELSRMKSEKVCGDFKTKLDEHPTHCFNYNDHDKRDPPDFSQSQQTEHEKNNEYIVDPNSEVFWDSISVKKSQDTDRPFQCITCRYTAKYKASVQRHFKRHHTSDNRPYKCMLCEFATKTKDQITLHNKKSRSNEVLTCKICGFTSVHKCQFLMHEKEHYAFKCVLCSFRCKKKPDMQKHFTVLHLGNGLKCRSCDFQAVKQQSLVLHEASHKRKRILNCQFCEYTSLRRSLLRNHINRHHKTKVAEKVINDSKCVVKEVSAERRILVSSEYKDKNDLIYT